MLTVDVQCLFTALTGIIYKSLSGWRSMVVGAVIGTGLRYISNQCYSTCQLKCFSHLHVFMIHVVAHFQLTEMFPFYSSQTRRN